METLFGMKSYFKNKLNKLDMYSNIPTCKNKCLKKMVNYYLKFIQKIQLWWNSKFNTQYKRKI